MIAKTILYTTACLILYFLELPLWFIFIVLGVEITLSIVNRWQRTNTLTPEQSIGGLIALLRIRSAEIGSMYHSIRDFQKNTMEGSWIPLFMAEYRIGSSYCLYQEPCEKREKKYSDKAQALYKKRFELEYDHYHGLLSESDLSDLGVAMLCWTSGLDTTIRLLNSIHCDSTLSQHVCALLREYRLIRFLTLDGNYHILFKDWRPISNLVRERYRLIRFHWKEVFLSLESSVLITQASTPLGFDRCLLNDVWEEYQVLAEMERGLCKALSQKNAADIGWNGKNEATFFQQLKSNPIWKKLHGYEPCTSPIDR